jgi:hypothetical protein
MCDILSDGNITSLQAADVERCADPTTHLYWSVYHETNALSNHNQEISTAYTFDLVDINQSENRAPTSFVVTALSMTTSDAGVSQ